MSKRECLWVTLYLTVFVLVPTISNTEWLKSNEMALTKLLRAGISLQVPPSRLKMVIERGSIWQVSLCYMVNIRSGDWYGAAHKVYISRFKHTVLTLVIVDIIALHVGLCSVDTDAYLVAVTVIDIGWLHWYRWSYQLTAYNGEIIGIILRT